MNKRTRYLLLAVALVALGAIAFGPALAQDDVPGAGEGGIIIEAYFGSDPMPLNPLVCSESTCQDAAGFMLPGLVAVDPTTAQFAESGPGAMAIGWDISEDGKTYTFHLRDDYTWNDGTPVTSADFLYSWNAIKSGELLNTLFSFVPEVVESMEAPDPQTLVVTFGEADCRALANASIPPLPSHIMPEAYADLNELDYNTNPTVTGGFLKFGSFRPAEQLALIADQNYPDAIYGYVVPEGYIYKNVPDQTVLTEQFLAGEINFINAPTVSRRADIRAAAEAGDVQLYDYAGDFWDYLAFNLADPANPQNGLDENGNAIPQGYHPIFGNKEVRQALARAVSIDDMIQAAVFGEGTRMASFLIQSSWAYDHDLAPIPYEPEVAAQMLEEVGWVDDDNNPDTVRVAQGVTLPDGTQVPDGTPMRFTMLGNEGNTRRAAEGQLLQDQLKQIGVEAIYQAVDFSTWIEIVNAQTFDAVMLAWSNSYPDDPDATQLFTPVSDVVGSGNNFTSFNNPEFTELNERARTLPGCDIAERAEIYHRMQEIMQDELPYLWMYSINGMYAARANVMNFDPYPAQPRWNLNAWYVN